MRYLLTVILFSLLSLAATAQPEGKEYHKFWVEFTNKQHNPFSLERPYEFLSQRALDRRANQGISLDSTDLPVTPLYVDSLRNMGAAVLHRSKWLNAVSIETTDSLLLAQINNLGFVQLVEPVAATEVDHYQQEQQTIDKAIVTLTEANSGEQLMYGEGFNQIEMLNGHYLHELGYTGQGMYIAVMDGGFRDVNELMAFSHLYEEGRLAYTWDYVEGEEDVYDDGTHGLYVLSTMAANAPAQLVGTAPDATYFLLRTEDGGSEYRIEEDNWVAAAEFADSAGVDVINSSLGYNDFDDDSMDYTYADMDGNTARVTKGADMAAEKGVLVVTSAGNKGNSAWRYITAPGDGDKVFTIGAVSADGYLTSFSSRGPTADGRIKPDVMAQGLGTKHINLSDGVSGGAGTSFSSPVMAGLVACLWQAVPDKTNLEVMEYIRQSASQYDNPDGDMGYGIPDFQLAHTNILEEGGAPFVRDNTPVAYPNPFNNTLSVMLFTEVAGTYTLEVFDGYGQQYLQTEAYIGSDRYFKFDLSELGTLQSGVYFVRVRNKDTARVIRVMKL